MSTVIDKVLLIFDRSASERGYTTRIVNTGDIVPDGQRPTRDEIYRIISKTTPAELVLVTDGIDNPLRPYLKFTVNPNYDPDSKTDQDIVVVDEEYIFDENAEAAEHDDHRDHQMVVDNSGESHSRYRHEMKPDKTIVKRALQLTFKQRDCGQIGDYTDTERGRQALSAQVTGRQVKTYEVKFREGAKDVLRSIGERHTRRKLVGEDIDVVIDELNKLNEKAPYAFSIVKVKKVESPDGRYKLRCIVDVAPL